MQQVVSHHIGKHQNENVDQCMEILLVTMFCNPQTGFSISHTLLTATILDKASGGKGSQW